MAALGFACKSKLRQRSQSMRLRRILQCISLLTAALALQLLAIEPPFANACPNTSHTPVPGTSDTDSAGKAKSPSPPIPAEATILPHAQELPHILIPVLPAEPHLADFLASTPTSNAARSMLRIRNFVQRYPEDGLPPTEPTTAYVGYTHENLYVAFVCKDDQPSAIRGHMLQRDNLSDDDFVQVMIDTFADQRRAFLFRVNPLGIQADALYTELTGTDFSFDTVWDSWGQKTSTGWVTLMRIPFASLYFDKAANGAQRTWGLLFSRSISRKNEYANWPAVRHNIAGQLTQEALAEGFENIESGKNWQFIPYALAHSERQLNTVDPTNPYFSNLNLQGYTGLDTKFILHNSLVLDMTFNPDFSQIGINNPAPPNQRFPFYFPELRPFFIENASYFQTPFNLYYTPNIVMPQFGQRLTGKVGPWAIGLLNVDDRNPGLQVPPTNPDFGSRSHYYIGRVNRDIGPQSNLGAIFADYEYLNSFNRNGGVDYRARIGKRWTWIGQAITSETRNANNSRQSGQAYYQALYYSDLHRNFSWKYRDVAAGYLTQTGFFTRPDVRQPYGSASYTFRPQHSILLSHTLGTYAERIWDHTGLPLDFYLNPYYSLNFVRKTSVSFFADLGQDRLRPKDYPALPANVEYQTRIAGGAISTSPNPQVYLRYRYYGGQDVNYAPVNGLGPNTMHSSSQKVNYEFKPTGGLDISGFYEFDHYTHPSNGDLVYDSHQAVTRWNLQMTKAWSINFIGEYVEEQPNTAYTSTPYTKDGFGDILLTYLPHPGTAFYLGYTTDYINLNGSLCTRLADGYCNTNDPILPTITTPSLNDQRIVYIKVSHLFRF